MKKVLLISAFSFIFLFLPGEASACTCPPVVLVGGKPLKNFEQNVDEAFRKSSTVFAGRVLSVGRSRRNSARGRNRGGVSESGMTVTFRIESVWKKKMPKHVTVYTGYSDADCGFPFEVGEKYLVYAFGEKNLLVSACSRTKVFSDAAREIGVLDRLKDKRLK
jgi:hypothetical protein